MKKDRFTHVCLEAEAGHDAFVTHPETGESGRVIECSTDHIVVDTATGERHCWDFKDCEERERMRGEWPYRA